MHIKVVISFIATAIAVISYAPYIRDIRSGKTKPHGFSWLIWALLAYVAGFAQLAAGGGFGAMVALVTATISLWIAFISIKGKSVKITRSDWVSLGFALVAIPVWAVTKQPLLAVIIVSVIDIVGFWPTIRKSHSDPHKETVSTYSLSTLKHVLTVVAQQEYNLTTVLYPASLAVMTGGFVAMLIVRKKQIPQHVK
ncbi:MAG TPA: hypothetical protein VIH90_02235 [Candidatus Saccharimonadales bacterium]